MPPLNNQRQELFCQNAARGIPDTQAYESAGFKPNKGNACSLKKQPHIGQRIKEIQNELFAKSTELIENAVSKPILTRQWLLDALLENIQISLGRKSVAIGPVDNPRDTYFYRGEIANNGIRMAGTELGMFRDEKTLTIRSDLDKLSDLELVETMVREGALFLEHQKATTVESKDALGEIDTGGADDVDNG